MTPNSAEKRAPSKASTGKVWDTKYGKRRVKEAKPTLEEAIFAAKGITDDVKGQIEIAAELMGLSEDEVRPQVMKSARLSVQIQTNTRNPAAARSFVVERRVVRRVAAPR
jgi:hypothetical protein